MMLEQDYLNMLDKEIIERFKTAVEIGKWPDGRALTDEQKATCMQAIIKFEHMHLPEDQRTGYVPPKETPCDTSTDSETPIKWK